MRLTFAALRSLLGRGTAQQLPAAQTVTSRQTTEESHRKAATAIANGTPSKDFSFAVRQALIKDKDLLLSALREKIASSPNEAYPKIRLFSLITQVAHYRRSSALMAEAEKMLVSAIQQSSRNFGTFVSSNFPANSQDAINPFVEGVINNNMEHHFEEGTIDKAHVDQIIRVNPQGLRSYRALKHFAQPVG